MGEQQPKYRQIVTWIEEKIKSGELQAGKKLYSENELSGMFGLSRQTVRHAIAILEQRGLVTRIQGSGTYVGEAAASSRNRERTMNIAVISTYVDSYIFPSTLQGIEEVLSGNGYMTQIAFTNNSAVKEGVILENLLQKDDIDGLIVEPARSAIPNPNIRLYQAVMKRKIPLLFFNSRYPKLKAPYVSLDDKLVGKKAVEYLIACGHEKIGGIFKSDDGQGHQRYAGYMEAMLRHSRTDVDHYTVWLTTEDVKDIYRLEEYIFYRIKECTALLCYNDEVASLIAGMCAKRGTVIPEQLSVVGIDNLEMNNAGDVKISSYPHPKAELGRKAAENLIRMIENPGFDGNYLFDAELVERGSVKRLK